MKLFDLHCDTPLLLYRKKEGLFENSLHVSLSKASCFEKYVQCAAVWSDKALTDEECLAEYINASDYFLSLAGNMTLTSRNDLSESNRFSFIQTVEDARLLCNNTDNLPLLFDRGVRVLTLLWGKKSSVGSAWNEDEGSLTPFGHRVLDECFSLGIIPDISHSNIHSQWDIIKKAREMRKSIIATHANAYSVCNHKRNLTDRVAKEIARSGGVIGISLYPPHLKGERANIDDVVRHILYYIKIAGEDTVCLGCDFDGIDSTPDEINHVGDLYRLFERLCSLVGSSIASKVFYDNAYNFFINNLPQERANKT